MRGAVPRAAAGALALALVAVGGGRPRPAPAISVAARSPFPAGLEYAPPAPGTYELPPIQSAADGEVLDARGSVRRLGEFLGDRIALLSFVYTRCTDARGCPLATAVFHMLHAELVGADDLRGEVRLITLSFDPDHDGAAVMARYARLGGVEPGAADAPWEFLTTRSAAQLGPILDGYGQYVVPERDAAGEMTGRFRHVLKVYLVDRQRRVRNIYSASFQEPELVLNDVRTLLGEEGEG